MMRNFLFGLPCALGLVFCSTTSAQAAEQSKTPHVVILLVDDMGYGDPGCYNPNSKIPTPHIDRLAREGMRFTDAHAPGPLCHLSRYGLITGRYPFRTDVSRWREHPLIDEGQQTVASMLRSQGYRTAMVGKWHLGFAEAGYDRPLPGGPVDCGFDTFFGIRASTDIPPYFYIRGDRAVAPPTRPIEANYSDGWTRIQGAFWRAGLIAPDMELADVLPRFTEEATHVIQEHARKNQQRPAQQPLFLYLALPAPHTPWLPSPEMRGRSGAGLYGDFTVMVDAMVGRIMNALEDAHFADDTLFLFTSDNGPVWYDQDVERFDHDSAGPLRGMKADAWEAGHRMPLIVRWPAKVRAGSVSHQLFCFTDLLATLAAICGAKLPADVALDSHDFSAVLTGEQPAAEPVRETLVIPSGAGMMTIRWGDWKLIDGLGSGGFSQPARVESGPEDPPGQLYDLGSDVGEARNLYQQRREIVQRMQKLLAAVTSGDGN